MSAFPQNHLSLQGVWKLTNYVFDMCPCSAVVDFPDFRFSFRFILYSLHPCMKIKRVQEYEFHIGLSLETRHVSSFVEKKGFLSCLHFWSQNASTYLETRSLEVEMWAVAAVAFFDLCLDLTQVLFLAIWPNTILGPKRQRWGLTKGG